MLTRVRVNSTQIIFHIVFMWPVTGRRRTANECVGLSVQSRFAETLTLTITLNPNANFGESGFGESGRHRSLARRLCCLFR